MSLFLLIYFVLFVYIAKHTKYNCFTEPFYWLSLFWILILGVYLTSGIQYKYGLTLQSGLFLVSSGFFFYRGFRKGISGPTKCFCTEESNISVNKYILTGIIGGCLFVGDYIRLNGIAEGKGDSQISFLGSLGALFMPILLLLGLYLNAKKIKRNGSFSIIGILLMLGYSIPCVINAGREAILFIVIGIISMFGYKKILDGNRYYSKQKYSLLLILGLFVVAFLFFKIIEISQHRFSDNEINVLLTYKNVSSQTMEEASKWGNFEFLYYNIASYFSHQIPFLDFTLTEYDGPYMFGMYELNIVSRRLPDFIGLDYKLVSKELNYLFSVKGESFSGAWNTVFGSLIIDFTWLGAIVITYICGKMIGKAKKKFINTLDSRYAVLIALICVSSFSTIQLGPFYQTQIYGAYLWWYLIFRRNEKNILI